MIAAIHKDVDDGILLVAVAVGNHPFEMDERKLFKIGVNFSAKTRNIEKWVVEIL